MMLITFSVTTDTSSFPNSTPPSTSMNSGTYVEDLSSRSPVSFHNLVYYFISLGPVKGTHRFGFPGPITITKKLVVFYPITEVPILFLSRVKLRPSSLRRPVGCLRDSTLCPTKSHGTWANETFVF